ncbi:MAG: hypothetical protein WBK44_00895 [Smithellaceae bacterium]|nr:hypothetical protein [Syntrophaceae bacterium]
MKRKSENLNPVVYLDTNALNFLCDKFRGKSKRPLKYFDISLSWPLIDEIECNSVYARTVELAEFVWQVTTRKVFLTVGGLVGLEAQSAVANRVIPFSSYYDYGKSHLAALNDARKGRTSNQTREALRESIGKQKERICNWEREQRKEWASQFSKDTLMPKGWSEFRRHLQEQRYFNQVLYGMLKTYGLSDHFTRESIMNLEHGSLPAVSIGIEFYVALQYLLDSQPQNLGKPNRGDLPDMQHAFYAGLCNYFVTDDSRVRHILSSMIKLAPPMVVGHEAFLAMLPA